MRGFFARSRLRRETFASTPDESRMSLADVEALLREIAAARTDQADADEDEPSSAWRIDGAPRAPKMMS